MVNVILSMTVEWQHAVNQSHFKLRQLQSPKHTLWLMRKQCDKWKVFTVRGNIISLFSQLLF